MNEEIKYNKDKNSIKIWPYLDDISQAVIPYSDSRLSLHKDMVINLDFSNVKRVNSSGATIALAKLMSILPKTNIFRIVIPEKTIVENYFQTSGFLTILDNYFNIVKSDLFENIQIQKNTETHVFLDEKQNIKTTSLPIFQLKYDKNSDRTSVDEFSDWIIDVLENNLSKYDIRLNILSALFHEIAKNTQDHAKNNAYFGLDIIENNNSNTGELIFSCSDLGNGIYMTIRNYLQRNHEHFRKDAGTKLSFTDAYQFAFKDGFSTSLNTKKNQGAGMSMIRDYAYFLGLDLSIWDARSMLIVSQRTTHSELRKNAYNTGNKVGFYYYGRLKF